MLRNRPGRAEEINAGQRTLYQANRVHRNAQQTEYNNKEASKDMAAWLLRYKRSQAKTKGIPCTITKEDIIVPTHCPVLGVELTPRGQNRDTTASIDKFIPSLGYVPGNVHIISTRANKVKSDGTLEEFEALAKWMQSVRDKS